MAQGLLQLLAEKLEMHDVSTRVKFESDTLTSYLRLLISPSKLLHPVVLRILRGGSNESEFGELDDSDLGSLSASKAFAELDDSERDMMCYALFDRHKEQFISSLTEVAKSCRMLVNNNRPAYTCASNIALLASSSISAVSGLIDPGSSEAMARLFFEFCGLLGSILKTSSGTESQANNWSIYKGCVLAVFRTVYNMLNAIEFSHFVRQVKSKGHLNESDTIGSLSTCLAQMLSYLGGADELNVASEIIQTFGLVASGLAATVGTSMLYPVETVQDLVSGKTGHLSSEQRRHLKSITSMSVWEPRSIAISKSRPVQIIIDDDEEMFASLNDHDFDDILGDSIDMGDQQNAMPASQIQHGKYASLKPIADANVELSIADFNKRTSVLTIDDDDDRQISVDTSEKREDKGNDEVIEIQLNSQDALNAARRRQQTKMDKWFSTGKNENSPSLTSQLLQRKAAAATASSRDSEWGSLLSTRSKKTNGSSVLSKLRSNFMTERQLQLQRETALIPKQAVNAPRSMATATASANVKISNIMLPAKASASAPAPLPPPPMYVRNASKAAIEEMEKEKERQQAASRKVYA
ncbi:hypothetical protein J3B02_004584, partial [Coemansia erecta]